MSPIDPPSSERGPDPLDPEERALAQALRALPAGSPSPALDARILAAAQAAVAGPAPARRRRLAGLGAGGWGWMGTAAAAVLAVGVTLRMGGDGQAPDGVEAEVTAPGAAEMRRREEAASSARLQADVVADDEREAARQAARAEAPAPAAAAPAPERRRQPAAPASAPAPVAAPPAPMAAPPPPPPPSPAATAEAVAAVPEAAQQLDTITVTGTRLSRADIALDAPVADDARLDPLAWIHRIRDRRDGGDAAGARESLALFERTHPRIAVPDDLEPLRE
jgi:hypothetical protein